MNSSRSGRALDRNLTTTKKSIDKQWDLEEQSNLAVISEESHSNENSQKSGIDKGTQVYFDEGQWNFFSKIMNDKQLLRWTGINSFEILRTIEKCCANVELINEAHFFQLDLINRILIVFVKLKTNLNINLIGNLFDISRTTASNFL